MNSLNFPKIGDIVFYRTKHDEFWCESCGYERATVTAISICTESDAAGNQTDEVSSGQKLRFQLTIQDEDFTDADEDENAYTCISCMPDEVCRTFFPSEEAICAEIEKELEPLRIITASPYIDRHLIKKFLEHEQPFSFDPVCNVHDTEKRLLAELQAQFGMLELQDMYNTFGEKHCIDFLNGALLFWENRPPITFDSDIQPPSQEITEEFLALAAEAEQHPVECLDPPMTIREFLKMCRVAYDAAGVSSKYPPGASDFYLYCQERRFGFQDDFRHFIHKDWDSPEIFQNSHFLGGIYHPEELQYGGMCIRLYHNPQWCSWCGNFSYGGYDKRTAHQAILSYIALRKKGYPLTCHDPHEILRRAGYNT